RPLPHSSSRSSVRSSISMVGLSSSRTARRRWSTATATCLPAMTFGVLLQAPSPHDQRKDLVRPSAWPDRPVPHEHVGTVFLLRHARDPGLLHDQTAAAGAGQL